MKEVLSLDSPPGLDGLELQLLRSIRPCIVARQSLAPYVFSRCSNIMKIAEAEQVVSTTQGGAWARVDCPIRADASVQFAFEVLKDKVTDEGTCYGIAIDGCAGYDKAGAIA